jgi:hypothetical protein
MHTCEICGHACYCDLDDCPLPAPDDCRCDHEGSGLGADGEPLDDDDEALGAEARAVI